MITLKEYLIETDINTYKKIIKNFRINNSSYKRHKGAIRQVNQYGR